MSLLDAYSGLMEQVTWQARTSIDQYGDASSTTKSIYCIWFDDEKMVTTDTGERYQQVAFIMTTESVSVGDIIVRNGYSWPVQNIMEVPTFDGKQFRVVNLGTRQL